MMGFLFPGRNPLLHRKQSFLCLSGQQLWLVWNNYKKVKEIQEAAVEFDHFYYYKMLVQCKQRGLNISRETAHLQRCHWNQENSNLKSVLVVNVWKTTVFFRKERKCGFCGSASLNLLTVRLSIIVCQSFYFLSILSSHALPSRFYKCELCHISVTADLNHTHFSISGALCHQTFTGEYGQTFRSVIRMFGFILSFFFLMRKFNSKSVLKYMTEILRICRRQLLPEVNKYLLQCNDFKNLWKIWVRPYGAELNDLWINPTV